MRIREADSGDCRAIGALALELLAVERRFYPEMGSPTPWAGSESEIRRQMRLPGSRFFVAEREGRIVGYVRVMAVDSSRGRGGMAERLARRFFNVIWRRPRPNVAATGGLISGIFVLESERRSGAGRLLLAAAEEWLRSVGMKNCTVHVMAANEAALDFWADSDYRPLVIGMQKRL